MILLKRFQCLRIVICLSDYQLNCFYIIKSIISFPLYRCYVVIATQSLISRVIYFSIFMVSIRIENMESEKPRAICEAYCQYIIKIYYINNNI